MKSLIDKNLFPGLDQCTWLYTGAESPPYAPSLEAMNEYMRHRQLGPIGRERNTEIELSLRGKVAQLLNGQPEHIALLSNASEAISAVALSLDLKAGDNVVVHTLEFPSGILPWLSLQQAGVDVRVVPHSNWNITPESVLDLVDHRTRLVLTSHVSYISGARIDYKKLYDQLKQTQTLLLVDVTQSLGVVPVDLEEADIMISSSYKWLLSTHGLGIMALNPSRTAHLRPQNVGWRGVSDMFSPTRFEKFTFFEDARRFELGFPSYSTIYAMNASIETLLDIGIENIEQHILQLGRYLIEQLRSHGYEVMTPIVPEQRAGNICVLTQQGAELADQLFNQGIYLWGGDGRFRASIHLFNDKDDIDRLLTNLPQPS